MDYFNECGNLSFLKIDSSRLDSFIKYINENNENSIGINMMWGYQFKDLDFLKHCQNIEQILIVDTNIDISGINYLKNLKFLSTNSNPYNSLDLSNFKNIEDLRIDYHKNWKNLSSATSLRRLLLNKYKADNLLDLSTLKNLEDLELIRSRISSLKGIENLRKLKHFKGIGLNKLTDLAMKLCIESMIDFRLEKCKLVINHEAISVMKNIEILYYVDCGVIKNLNFVSKLKNLKDIRIPFTDVEDGNVEKLRAVERFYFTYKKHFSHSYEELLNLKI